VTRYQYLDLVAYLHTRRWVQNEDAPNILIEPYFKTWSRYYQYTNQLLYPHESCNCHRDEGAINMSITYENRYYADAERGNYVTYLSKQGSSPIKGHWDPHTLYTTGNHTGVGHDTPSICLWQYNWSDVIRYHVAQLIPPPQYVVFNSGLWGGGKDLTPTVLAEIRKALDDHNMVGIYKTTTRRQSEQDTQLDPHDREGCNTMHACFNLWWTANLSGSDYYWDRTHFTAKANEMFNRQLLGLLRKLNNATKIT
jgi:hypothetical protein